MMRLQITLIASILLSGCTSLSPFKAEIDTANTAPDACCADTPAPAAFAPTAQSVYLLDSRWRDDANAERPLRSLAGKVQILAMGYSSCKFACPRIIADLQHIQDGLDPATAANTGIVFASIDPQTDTPERLATFRAERELPPSWTLLTAPAETVQELAVVLGVKYRKISDTDFAHSNVITVLDSKGEIVYQVEGLAADPAAAIAAARTAAATLP